MIRSSRICAVVLAAGAVVAPALATATTVPDGTDTTAVADSTPESEAATTTGAADEAIPSLTGPNPEGCVDDWQGEPLFVDQFKVQNADNYSLTYFDNYKVLTIGATYPGGPEEVWVLVQCGTPAPELTGDLAGASTLEIPVQTIFSASSSHLGFIDTLSLSERLTGFGQPDAVVLPSIRERIDAGDVIGFAPNYEIDAEAVIAADPDVFVSGGFDDPAFPALRDAGIPVVANAEWLETSPQGWAEWVGFFAALSNTEGRATEAYNGWIGEYDDAAAIAAGATEQPTVLDGSLFEGTWYRAGGAGVRAQFIADAGGDYLFDDDSTGTVEVDIETVLADGADANVWVGVSDFFTTKTEAIAVDERYGSFAAWDELGVFATSNPPDPTVSYAESGPTMIGPYLLDFVKAFHPELAEDHEFIFLGQIANT